MFGNDLCTRDYEEYISNKSKLFGGKRVLDVGCGTGSKTALMGYPKVLLYGTDIENKLHFPHKDKFKFFETSLGKIAAEKASFDVVTSFDVIEHMQDDRGFVKEISRVLKPKGLAITLTPNRNRIANLVRGLFREGKYPLDLGTDPYLGGCIHIREYDAKELEKLFVTCGFRKVDVTPFWFGVRYPLLERLRLKWKIPRLLRPYVQYWVVEAYK